MRPPRTAFCNQKLPRSGSTAITSAAIKSADSSKRFLLGHGFNQGRCCFTVEAHRGAVLRVVLRHYLMVMCGFIQVYQLRSLRQGQERPARRRQHHRRHQRQLSGGRAKPLPIYVGTKRDLPFKFRCEPDFVVRAEHQFAAAVSSH